VWKLGIGDSRKSNQGLARRYIRASPRATECRCRYRGAYRVPGPAAGMPGSKSAQAGLPALLCLHCEVASRLPGSSHQRHQLQLLVLLTHGQCICAIPVLLEGE
jgi:hypothetical protein